MRRDVREDTPFNFVMKLPVSRINTKIKVPKFEAKDPETGETILDKDGNVTYATLPEYLATYQHTIKALSTDGYFIKGMEFTYFEMKQIEAELLKDGLVEGVDYWFLAHSERRVELAKDEWNPEPETEVKA